MSETIEGVDLSKVNEELVTKTLIQALACKPIQGLTPVAAKRLPLGEKVRHLSRWYKDHLAPEDLVRCLGDGGECGGVSEAILDCCPYCGLGNEDSASVVEDVQAVGSVVKENAAMVPVSDTVALTKLDENVVFRFVEVGENPTEQTLDEISAAVRRMQHMSVWAVGKQIKVVFERGLWKLRQQQDGKPAYTSFAQWCQAELEMPNSKAFILMDTVAKFSREQVENVGPTKLALVLRVPEEEQGKLLERAEQGATYDDLRAQVAKVKIETGFEKRDTGRKDVPQPKKASEKTAKKQPKAKKEEPKEIVEVPAPVVQKDVFVPIAEGEKVLPLQVCIDGVYKPTRKVADGPVAIEELSRDLVRKYYVLLRPEGLVLKVVTERV